MSDKKFIFITLVAAILGPFACDLYLTSLPEMTTYFMTSETVMQHSITVYFLGLTFLQLLWGPFSDKLGRRKALILGGILSLLGCTMALFAPTAGFLNLGRFIQGAGGAASVALGRSVLRDRFSGPRLAEAAGIFGIFFALIPAVAPIIGGFIQEAYGWQANFIFLFYFTLFIILFTWKVFPESNLKLDQRAMHWERFKQNYQTLLKDKNFLGFSIGATAGYAGSVAYLTISPFLFQKTLGLSAREGGFAILALTIGLMIGSYHNAKWVRKHGIQNMLYLGYFMMGLGGLSLLAFNYFDLFSVTTVVTSTLIYIYGASFLFSSGAAGAIQPFGHIAGSAAALFGFFQLAGTTLLSFLVSFSADASGFTLGATYTLMALISYLGHLFLIDRM